VPCRPESIAEGRFRLHVSDNLKAESTLIDQITSTVNMIKETTSRLHQPSSYGRKKARTGMDVTSGLDHEVNSVVDSASQTLGGAHFKLDISPPLTP
jgi:hypothetical protein